LVVIVTAVLLTLPAIPVYASVTPMSWGFPQLIQNNSLTNFENNFVWQNDFEFTDISFPTAGSSEFGFSAFPTISQVSSKVNMASSFSFTHQQESMVFSYPYVSMGFSPIPSMGFL